MKKIIACLLVVIMTTAFLTSCTKEGEYELSGGVKIILDDTNITEVTGSRGESVKIRKKNIKVLFELEEGGSFVMELYPECAPKTVRNFCDLVYDEFYNGITFHRIVPGFVAQAGDPTATGTGGSKEKVKGEFEANGYDKNTLKHEKGVVSMARAQDFDSATSQFFICLDDARNLDGEYAAFGKVIYGMDNVDSLAQVAVDENAKPYVDVVIKKASIISDAEYKKLTKE